MADAIRSTERAHRRPLFIDTLIATTTGAVNVLSAVGPLTGPELERNRREGRAVLRRISERFDAVVRLLREGRP